MYQHGDWIVFSKRKDSRNPGPRARRIEPAQHGDEYTYVVDKYWVVDEVLPSGVLRLRTRTGKTHLIDQDHPNLRTASWWERLVYRNRFPEPEVELSQSGNPA